MSTEIIVPAEDPIEVTTESTSDELSVTVEADTHVDVVVGPGEGDASVEVASTTDTEIAVEAAVYAEVEVVEHDTFPAVDHVVEVIAGPRGEKGDPGVGMPIGGDPRQVLVKATYEDYAFTWADPSEGGDVRLDHYVHLQPTPATVWTIVHPLAFRPAVSVVDSAGSAVEGDVQYLSEGVVQITFSSGFSGSAYLS